MATQGTLYITVIEAELTRDVGTADDLVMDPYVVLKNRSNAMRTCALENAGKLPKWNETLEVTVRNISDDILMRVMDENVATNTEIGNCNLKLGSLCVNGGIQGWFPLAYGSQCAGRIHLKAEWCPSGSDPVAFSASQMPGLQ